MPKKKSATKNNNSRAKIYPPLTELLDPQILYQICDEKRGQESVEDILLVGNWIKNESSKKHNKWVRYVLLASGIITTCTVTFSSTPGDKRAWNKQRANLMADYYHFKTAKECGGHAISAIIKKGWAQKNLC
ncbi:hypothetical protein CPAV1605_860 [seawater metagenome]|uniref:Uncharacterized protein n=1 Tax=seawater metagenome TaxID=1561972 RepID=A0A5E8CLP0_9ZZZZ